MTCIRLTVVSGALTGHSFDVPSGGATLGRSRVADIHLEDGLLSRVHCRFVCDGEVSVQDLGSSNGTLLNGAGLGVEPHPLHEGDVVTVGDTVLRVSLLEEVVGAVASESTVSSQEEGDGPMFPGTNAGAPTAPLQEGAGAIDLGLEPKEEAEAKRRSPLLGLMLALGALLVLVVGTGLFYAYGQHKPKTQPSPRRLSSVDGQPFEFRYERLVIDARKLFRYTLVYDNAGVLSLAIDDLGDADRSFSKGKELSPRAREALRKELIDSRYASINEMFPERSADGVTLRRKSLTIVFGTEVWTRTAENVDSKVFDALCERLETFGRNELGAWATQYSVSELREMGREQLQLARRYWEQRDLGDEKLFLCVMAYKKGLSALETLNPKPDFAVELSSGLRTAETLLDERYEVESFAVDQALNTQRYEVAAESLRRILRMIPDRDDERNGKATEKLLSVENRFLKKGGR